MPRAIETDRASRPKTARELGIMCGFPPPPEKRPTLENWDLPPFNRWTFQNVRSLIPTVDVPRGDAPISPLQAASAELGGIGFELVSGETTTIDRFLNDTYTDGFLVMHRGKVLTEQYFNDMAPGTPHLSQSLAKSVVGLTAGVLHGRGLIDLSAPLADLMPEIAACGYADATLSQVLDMQTGVRFTEDYGAPDSDMTRIDVASGWRPARPGESRPTIRDVILTLPKIRPHGDRFEYRSIETDMAAWALERATGQPLAELVSDAIWRRIGAERDAYFTVDAAGTALADGGFNATLRDYARFGRLAMEGGRAGGAEVVPASWIEGMREAGSAEKAGPPYTEVLPNCAYRRFWWICDKDRGDLAARGVFGQLIYADPVTELLIVKLSTWPDYVIPAFAKDTFRAVAAIRRALTEGA